MFGFGFWFRFRGLGLRALGFVFEVESVGYRV